MDFSDYTDEQLDQLRRYEHATGQADVPVHAAERGVGLRPD